MSEMPFNPDLLSVAMSIEYPECSIAANALSNEIDEALNLTELPTKVLHAVNSDSLPPKEYEFLSLDTSIDSANDNFGLYLIRPKKDKSANSSQDYDPILAAVLGHEDVFVPLGRSAKRGADICSYFLIGSEVIDDSLFVTMADEKTSRLDIIEDIRKLVSSAYSTSKKNIDGHRHSPLIDEKKLIARLVANEIAGKISSNDLKTILRRERLQDKLNGVVEGMVTLGLITDNTTIDNASDPGLSQILELELTRAGGEKSLDKAKESMLVRRMLESDIDAQEENLQIILEDGLGMLGIKSSITDLSLPIKETDSGRDVALSIIHLEDEDQLGVVTRGDIWIPILTYSRATDTLTFNGDRQLTSTERRTIISTAHHLVCERNKLEKPKGYKGVYLLKEFPSANYPEFFQIEPGMYKRSSRNREKLAKAFGFPKNNRYTPFYSHDELPPSLKNTNVRSLKFFNQDESISKDTERFFQKVGLDSMISNIIGETTPAEEELYSAVNTFYGAGGEKTVIVDNYNFGKVSAKALLGIKIEKSNGIYSVVISAAPADYGVEPRPIIDLHFSSSGSIFSRYDYSNEEASNKAEEFMKILRNFDIGVA